MFQFTQFPLPALCVQAGVTPHYECGVSPFGYPRIDGWSAPSRGFSQPPTSFIGSHRQGIHRWPFVAWVSHYKDARARYQILKGRDDETSSPRRRARARSLGAGEAYLHNGRQDGHPGHAPNGSRARGRVLIRKPASASTGCPCPAHSVMLHEPDGLDSLERR